ncbi:MAG: glycosyltransferase [Ruminococcaceae bacterium]|nr:glycosyltransferase [Oscillospiraceae bacterium]
MEVLQLINNILFGLFITLSAYQIIYFIVSFFVKEKKFPEGEKHRFAVLISARNEEKVIGRLVESVKKQDYPSELVDVYVVADNCTDDTAGAAAAAGAIVHRRFSETEKGKGYALRYLLDLIFADKGNEYYDGFFVMDADNLMKEDFITEMNKVFSAGYKIVNGYRAPKNFSDGWVASSSALWFLHECRHLNKPRMVLGTGCTVTGTGFLMHRDIVNKNGGWHHFLISEDTELTAESFLDGEKTGYCGSAIFYDEQPVKIRQSIRQRMRWTKGYLQVFQKYGGRLVRGWFKKGGFARFDLCMCFLPAILYSMLTVVVNVIFIPLGLIMQDFTPLAALIYLATAMTGGVATFFAIGLITMITEWGRIAASAWVKIRSLIVFPFMMLIVLPCSALGAFQKAEWKPIEHTSTVSVDEIKKAH